MKKANYDEIASTIISLVGGKSNVISFTHCATRLRFVLRDEKLADQKKLEAMDSVIAVVKGGGQFQVVVGTKVDPISRFIDSFLDNNQDEKKEPGKLSKKTSFIDKIFDTISKVFQPLLGILCAAGMVKGFNNLFTLLELYDAESGTYMFMNAFGDAIFMFLPIMLGYTSAKKFQCSQFIGVVIGAVLCYPTIQLSALSAAEPVFTIFAGTGFEMNAYVDLFGLPVIALDYTSTVIPVIIAVYFASKVQRWLEKIIPESLKFSLVPMFTLVITSACTLFVLGPLTTLLSNAIAMLLSTLYNLSPLVYGIILYGFILVLIIFGLHWGLIALSLTNISTFGYDFLVAAPGLTNVFTAMSAMIAVFLRTKDKKLKEAALSSAVSDFFGITEPSLYSVLLPLKKPFIYCCISNAIGGAIVCAAGVKAYTFGGWGIFQFPTYINPDNGDAYSMIWAIIGVGIATVVSFVLNYIGFREMKTEVTENIEETEESAGDVKIRIFSPMRGEIIPLKEVDDPAFAGKGLGEGVAVIPKEGKVYAPVDGTVAMFFETKHALALKGNTGEEILIHVGIDTCKLHGEYFTSHVKQGDDIKKGQLLMEFDLEKVKESGFEVISPITVTNSDSFSGLTVSEKGYVDVGDEIITFWKNNTNE